MGPLKKLTRKSTISRDARPQNPREIPRDDDVVSHEANDKHARGSEYPAISREAIGNHALGSESEVRYEILMVDRGLSDRSSSRRYRLRPWGAPGVDRMADLVSLGETSHLICVEHAASSRENRFSSDTHEDGAQRTMRRDDDERGCSMKNHTYVFTSDKKGQIAVELWETGEVTVMMRDFSSDIWSPKLHLDHEEGDPVQLAFEMENLDDLFVQAGVTRDYCVVHESRRWGQSNFCEKSIPEEYEGRECRFGGE